MILWPQEVSKEDRWPDIAEGKKKEIISKILPTFDSHSL